MVFSICNLICIASIGCHVCPEVSARVGNLSFQSTKCTKKSLFVIINRMGAKAIYLVGSCIIGLTHYLGDKQDFDVSSGVPSSEINRKSYLLPR